MCDGGILIEVCLSRIDEIHRRSFLSADRGCVCDIVLEIDSSGLPSGQGVWIEAGQKFESRRKNVSDVAFILWSSSGKHSPPVPDSFEKHLFGRCREGSSNMSHIPTG